MKNKSGLYIVSIVAVVAVVALIMMTLGNSTKDYRTSDTSGKAIQAVLDDGGTATYSTTNSTIGNRTVNRCVAGWKCKTNTTRAYQSSTCTWGMVQPCSYGCVNGVCILTRNNTQTGSNLVVSHISLYALNKTYIGYYVDSKAGLEFSVGPIIKNIGSSPIYLNNSGLSFTMEISNWGIIENVPCGHSTGVINAGQEITCNSHYVWSLSEPGSYNASIRIDSNHRYSETNEYDNTKYAVFYVY